MSQLHLRSKWRSRLPTPIQVKNDDPLCTLHDARAMILALPKGEQHRTAWQHAAELLLVAADSGKPADIEAATVQVSNALFLCGKLKLS